MRKFKLQIDMYVLHVPSEQDHMKNFSYAYNFKSKWIFIYCGSLRVKHQFFFSLMNESPLYYTCAGSYDDDWLKNQYYIIRSC